MTTWIVSQGDTGKPIEAILSDKNGVVDLTGCTVKAYMTPVGDFSTKKISGASCTVVSAPAGSVKYTFTSADVDTVGKYNFQFVVTNAASKETTFPTNYGAAGYIEVTITPGTND